jgi:hypothetical protein
MRKAWLFAMIALVGGCVDDAAERELVAALATQQRISAERDRLVDEMLATTQLMDSINLALAEARVGPSTVAGTGGDGVRTSARDRRRAVLSQVQEAIVRLDSAQASLGRARRRIDALEQRDEELLTRIDQYKVALASLKTTTERQMAELEAIIDSQRVQIAVLKTRLDTARTRAVRLEVEKAAVLDTLNTVYVVTGKKDSLLKLGVVVNEGSKFLFFGGKQLQPARDLDPALFTPYHRLHDSVIALPKPDKRYRIVSRHSPEYLASEVSKDGKVRGELHIAAPESFWGPSRFLILVEQ